jgi:hypothetical protein
MGKRVYEIARELSLEMNEVIERLKEAGVEVNNHLATVDDSVYERVFSKEDGRTTAAVAGSRRPYRVRVPGFVKEGEEVGLGDVIKRVTAAAGIASCGGCGRRAAALNRWVAFSGRHPR